VGKSTASVGKFNAKLPMDPKHTRVQGKRKFDALIQSSESPGAGRGGKGFGGRNADGGGGKGSKKKAGRGGGDDNSAKGGATLEKKT